MYKTIYMSYDSSRQVTDLLNREYERGWKFISCSGEFVFIFEKIQS